METGALEGGLRIGVNQNRHRQTVQDPIAREVAVNDRGSRCRNIGHVDNLNNRAAQQGFGLTCLQRRAPDLFVPRLDPARDVIPARSGVPGQLELADPSDLLLLTSTIPMPAQTA